MSKNATVAVHTWLAKIQSELVELNQHLDGYRFTDVEWGHAGDLGHVWLQLQQINAFLRQDDDA